MDTIFPIRFLRFPIYILLGLPDRLTFPLHSLRGTAIALTLGAARQAITASWGKLTPPTHSDWLHRLWLLLGMERISTSLTHSHAHFDKMWVPCITFLSNEFRELTCPLYLRVLHLTDAVAPSLGMCGRLQGMY